MRFITPEELEKDTITTEQKKAIKIIHSLLQIEHLSKKQITEKLKQEKFDLGDINVALKNCGTNWDIHAEYKAQEYIKSGMTSRDDIFNKLVEDGFTSEEARHAIYNNRTDDP